MESEQNTFLYTYTNYYNNRIFTLHDILSQNECVNLIEEANNKAGINRHPQAVDMVERELKTQEQINFVFYIIRLWQFSYGIKSIPFYLKI
jgi:hypothetical protein